LCSTVLYSCSSLFPFHSIVFSLYSFPIPFPFCSVLIYSFSVLFYLNPILFHSIPLYLY
jgi:hypothetical protein